MRSNEWYTPSKYIEAAREVMGSIDLDPASCELANQTVKAARFYTKEDSGLTLPWYGNIWLNPPFNRVEGSEVGLKSVIEIWVTHLIRGYQKGQIKQAVLLAPMRLETRWMQPLWEYPICLVAGRIHFHQPKRKEAVSPPFGAILVYLGPNEQRFIEVFSQFGRIARAIDTPHAHPANLTLW